VECLFVVIRFCLISTLALLVTRVSGANVVFGVIAALIILTITKIAFVLRYKNALGWITAWGYTTYLRNKFVLEIIRIVFPSAGWYLFTTSVGNPYEVTGPYSSYEPISRLVYVNSTRWGSIKTKAYGKLLLKAPNGAKSALNDYYLVGFD
jgi:hypothetical protein